MKVLVWSDIHLHNWPYGSTMVGGMNSRLLAQAKVMEEMANQIREEGVDHIVFCGDLFHTHGKIDSAVMLVAYQGIQGIMDAAGPNVRMDMLVGNHDTDRKDLSVHALHWLNAIRGVRVIDKPTHDKGTEFSFLPYTEDEKVLKKFLADANPICFMHQGFVNVPMASGFVVNEIMNHEMIPDHVRHVFTGHYHPFTKLPKATVVGSVMQHTWADAGDVLRGWLYVDTDTCTMVQYQSNSPRFYSFDMQMASRVADIRDGWDIRDGLIKNNYIRIHNFKESDIEQIRQEILKRGAASVEFVIKRKSYKGTVVKAISGKEFSIPELVREYEKEHNISKERSAVGKELMK